MGLRTNPSQRQRRLGEELRKMREASGMSATEAGTHAGLGRAHMSHIETGRTSIPEDKLRTLVHAYGFASHPLTEALIAMGKATGRGWWSDFRDTHNAHALDLAEMEDSAVSCRSFQVLYVPGLLQTAEYARSLMRGGEPDANGELIDRYVEFRMRRQRILTTGTCRFHAVIHEAALRMQYAAPDVMRRQIAHLVAMARLPNVRVQILPFKADVFPARFGTPFVVFDAAVPELNTVYVEHPLSSPFISSKEQLDQFSEAFDRLMSVSLTPIDQGIEPEFHAEKSSLGLIQHRLYEL
ncbi:helix-turn-helix domain-containing protein [Streptomyces abikoensis]|uniref:Helix-turn-helix domain-containing protein n=1 Tax=Streptomyces abikoensis TaxID=97398 RepID=A0ABW7T1L6_9ACTN